MDKKTLEIQIKLLANQALSQVKEFGDDIKNAADKAKGFTGDAKGVSASIKAMQAEAQRTANQMKLFGLTSSDLRNTTQNLKKTILDLTASGIRPESEEVQNLVQKYRELEEQTNKVEASEQGLFGVIGKLKNEIGSLAAVAAAVKVDKAVADLAKSSLDVNNSFQKIKDDFGIMLGDVEAGIGLFNKLQEFNFWTPFDIEQTSQAAKVLVSAKVPLKDLTDYLIRFGDIAQGDAQKFQSFINAFSKASAKGKADMEVLNVYTDQGVQILDALGQQLGKTTAEIVKMSSEGNISFQDLDNALNALASEGGLYYGTLEKAAMRLDAVQAGLDESVKTLKASFGQMLAPAISAVLTAFTNLVDRINSSPILKGLLAAAITTVVTLINVKAVQALITLAVKIWSAYAAQMGLNTALSVTNPLLLAGIAAVAVLTAGYVAYASSQQKAADESAELAIKNREQADSMYELAEAVGYLNSTGPINLSLEPMSMKEKLDSINDAISTGESRLKELKAKQANPPENLYYPGMKFSISENGKEWNPTEDLPAQIDRVESSLKKLRSMSADLRKKIAAAKAAATKNLGTDWQKKNADSVEQLRLEQQQSLEKLNEKAKSLYDGDIEKWDAYQKEKAALCKYYSKKIADEEKKLSEKAQKEADEARKVLKKWIDSDDPVSALEHEKNEALKKNAEAARKLWKDTYEKEAEYIRANAALTEAYDKKIADARAKAQKEQWKKKAEDALKQWKDGNPSVESAVEYAGASAMNAISDTDLGNLLTAASAAEALASALASVVNAAISCLMELENVTKILNWADTIVSKIFDYIGTFINEGLAPVVELMETLGESIGKILLLVAPLLQLLGTLNGLNLALKAVSAVLDVVGGAFEWLYNNVIVPVGNGIIDLANAVIDLINKIPFVNVARLSRLNFVGDMAVEMAETMTKNMDSIKRKFERLKDRVNSMLDSQLEALKSQYELGLISRQEYEKQAEVYESEADSKLYDINKAMEDHLSKIEKGTETVEDAVRFIAEQRKEIAESEDAYQSKEGVIKISSSGSSTSKSLLEKLQDIDIRSGRGTSGSAPTVILNVQGSVVTERELIDSVYRGLRRGQLINRYNGLGA